MVEITLALAVIGIGLAGIMALFPVGVQSSRDAIADNYSANVAEFFISYIRMQTGTATKYDALKTALATSKPSSESSISSSADTSTQSSSSTKLFTGTGVYKIEQGVGLDNSDAVGSGEIIDFSAIARVWKGTISYYDPTSDNNVTVTDTNGMKIMVEISWPAQLPYAKRQKKYFCLEVFRPI